MDMISIFLLLLLAAVGIGVIVLIGIAIANGRIGVAAIIGGLTVFLGIPAAFMSVLFIAYQAHRSTSGWISSPPQITIESPHQFSDFQYQTTSNPPTWAIALRPMLGIAIVFIVFLFLLARRGMGHAAAGGHGRIWPVLLAVPILALLLLGSVRYERVQSFPTPPPVTAFSQNIPAVQIQTAIQRQQESLKKSQAELAKQQAALAKQAAALAESLHKQIDQMDIHELMDKFDAPRIALKMPITPNPAALVIAAANAATNESKSDTKASADDAAAKAEAAKIDAEKKSEAVAESEKSHSSSGTSDEHAAATTEPAANQTAEVPAEKPAEATAVVEAEAPATPAPPAPPAPAAAPPTAAPPIAAAPAPPAPAAVISAQTVAATHSIAETTKVELPSASSTTTSAKKETPTASAAPPAWINDPPKRTGDVRREVIITDPYESDEECYQAADIYLMLRTHERLQQLKGDPYVAARLPSITFGNNGIVMADGGYIATGTSPTRWTDWRLIQLSQMGIGTDFLRRDIVAKNPGNNEPREYLETVQQSFGPMKKLYMQIEFTPAVDRELMQRWDGLARQERFGQVGVGAGFVLALLFSVWGLLRIDTATKGYYSKWLFLGVPAVIIAGIAFCAVDPFHMF